MKISTDELRAAYESGGYDHAIKVGLAAGLSYPATRTRLVRHGIHTTVQRRPQWGTVELKTCVELWNAGVPTPQIAATINARFGRQRTPHAIWRLMEDHPDARSRARVPWTRANRKLIADTVDQTIAHLAQRLGRTPVAVRNEMVRALYGASRRQRTRNADIGLGAA